jgi:hypothetical protein
MPEVVGQGIAPTVRSPNTRDFTTTPRADVVQGGGDLGIHIGRDARLDDGERLAGTRLEHGHLAVGAWVGLDQEEGAALGHYKAEEAVGTAESSNDARANR